MASSKVAVVNVMGSYFFCYMSLVQLVFFVNNSMSLQVGYIWVLRLQKEIFNSIIIRKKGFLNINFNLERNFADISTRCSRLLQAKRRQEHLVKTLAKFLSELKWCIYGFLGCKKKYSTA